MLSLILSVCIIFAGYETCEGKLISKHETIQECMDAMDSLENEINNSRLKEWEFQVTCTIEE